MLTVGCTPLPVVSDGGPTRTQPDTETREPDCSRRFDENDAGFQTCSEGDDAPSE